MPVELSENLLLKIGDMNTVLGRPENQVFGSSNVPSASNFRVPGLP
jgi:hypothetical protein